MSVRHPSYRLHKARNCAVVTIDGKDHYLGPYDSPESWEKYHRIVAEWMATRKKVPTSGTHLNTLTISELILAYRKYVTSYYLKHGWPTSEQDTIRQALRFLRKLYGSTAAAEFGPQALKAVRQAMIEHPITRKIKVRNEATGAVEEQVKVLRHGLCRKYINKQIGRIKRMFAWAVEEELLPVSVHQALLCVKSPKKGKRMAREKPRVKPVPRAFVDQVLPHLPDAVRAMVEVQYLGDMRPQDVVLMRAVAIDMGSTVWEYRPHCYKTEHLNDDGDPDQERVVFLGPRAQEMLKPFLTLDVTAYLFSPDRSEGQRNYRRREARKTPLWPSHLQIQAKKKAQRRRKVLKDRYEVATYRRTIRRACEKAGIPVWSPNQLRHSRSTEIRKRYGLEASKACAGQREIGVTQHYAEQDHDLARRVMAEIG